MNTSNYTITKPMRTTVHRKKLEISAQKPPALRPTRTAADLHAGESARVLLLTGPGRLCERLMALGLTRGAEITRLFNAPFGDPAAFRVRGFTLAMTLREAAYIRVTGDKQGKA